MLLNDFLTRSAQAFPNKIACICDDLRFSYEEIDHLSNRLAHALLDSGIQTGDRVGIYLENCMESVISIFAIVKAGGVFVVINPTTKEDKLVYMLNDCTAKGIVIDSHCLDMIKAVETQVSSLSFVVLRGAVPDYASKKNIRRISLAADLETYAEETPAKRCLDIDLAAIIYTSGSTGRPKGVTLTHLNMVSAVNSITEYLENRPDDIIINMLPLAFDYGLYQVLMSAKIGGTLVLEKSFTYPFQIIHRIKAEKVTGFPGVPTIFAILLQKLKIIEPADFDSVRYVSNTGAALPPAHIFRLREIFRNAKIYSMYGLTECKRVSYLPPEELDRRPTSVGRGMPNEEVYIVDERGNPVGPGVVGELVVRGSNVMKGYWNLPEETARVLRPGRYPWELVLYTGDLFKMDEDGFLYFIGRRDDMIKSRGEKVSPKEVENVIYELPDVQEAVVMGVPDEILGQAVKALVVKVPGSKLTEADIEAHCKHRLENFMVPKYVEFHETLAKTDSGKIIRSKHAAKVPEMVS